MGSIARAISSVAQPVSGGSTNFPTSGFGSGIGQAFQQLINQGALTPATGLPVTIPTPVTLPVTPTTSMSPIRRFNAVVDPRLSRTMSRPMFRPSRYDGQINQLLERLGITSLAAPQRRPDVDQLGRRYDDPRYYKMGGRVNYQDGGSSKTPPKFIPMDLESVAFRLFKDNLDNLTYNQKQTVYDYIEQNRNKKANGGRIGYADGTPAAGLVYRPEYEGPYMGPLIMGGPQRGQYYNQPGTLRSITGPDGAIPRPGMPMMSAPRPEVAPQINSIKEAMMSLPQTRSNPRMSAMRKLNQVQDPRMIRLMQMLRRQPAAMGGIMNLKMGGTPVEMDLRAKGGFVPIGKKERADDVPARLSKNEFVFTAKAVRNAGGGDIREGARKMYNLMNKLEAKR
jgi:hypothetical protein